MTAPDSCGCVACEFLARNPHYRWPPEHVRVQLPDGRVTDGTYWPRLARIALRIDGRAWTTSKWCNVDTETVRILVMPSELLV